MLRLSLQAGGSRGDPPGHHSRPGACRRNRSFTVHAQAAFWRPDPTENPEPDDGMGAGEHAPYPRILCRCGSLACVCAPFQNTVPDIIHKNVSYLMQRATPFGAKTCFACKNISACFRRGPEMSVCERTVFSEDSTPRRAFRRSVKCRGIRLLLQGGAENRGGFPDTRRCAAFASGATGCAARLAAPPGRRHHRR